MRNKLNTIPMISTQVNPGQFRQCLPIALDNVNRVPILYIVKNDKTVFQLRANIPIKRDSRGSETNNTVAPSPASARSTFHPPPACHPIGGAGTSPGRCPFCSSAAMPRSSPSNWHSVPDTQCQNNSSPPTDLMQNVAANPARPPFLAVVRLLSLSVFDLCRLGSPPTLPFPASHNTAIKNEKSLARRSRSAAGWPRSG